MKKKTELKLSVLCLAFYVKLGKKFSNEDLILNIIFFSKKQNCAQIFQNIFK